MDFALTKYNGLVYCLCYWVYVCLYLKSTDGKITTYPTSIIARRERFFVVLFTRIILLLSRVGHGVYVAAVL